MKTKLFSICVLALGFIALGVRAQTPAPAVDVSAAPQASQVVYSPRLPSAAELTNVAAAQGLTIDRIVQTSSQMTVMYRSANGQTNTVAYLLLPAAGATMSTVATTTPAPTVVYAAQPAYVAAPVYYYDPFYYPSYYAGPWYGPVSIGVGLGFGFRGGFHGGGFHGWHR
jgi:hypothetical protein